MTNANSVDILDFIWCAGFVWALLIIIPEIVRARKRTSRTTGTVVRVTTQFSSVLTFGPEVEFVDGQGNKPLCKDGYRVSWNEWPIGSQLTVVYDPHDPTNSFTEISRGMIVIWVMIGIPVLAFGLFQVARTIYGAWQSVWG